MTLRALASGLLLDVGGSLAGHEDCCCGAPCDGCTDATLPSGFNVTLAGIVANGNTGACSTVVSNLNATYGLVNDFMINECGYIHTMTAASCTDGLGRSLFIGELDLALDLAGYVATFSRLEAGVNRKVKWRKIYGSPQDCSGLSSDVLTYLSDTSTTPVADFTSSTATITAVP